MDRAKLEVCAAVVLNGGRLLMATRRSGSHLAGKWEFPGGKLRPNETPESCIKRELREELAFDVLEPHYLFSMPFDYADKSILLHFMLASSSPVDGAESHPTPAEGQKCGWFTAPEAQALDLAPADAAALTLLKDAAAGNLHDAAEHLDTAVASQLLDFMRVEDAVSGHHLPDWLRFPFVGGRERLEMERLITKGGLHTVCESAKCPNRCECWKHKTATFMILGGTCTRFCRFCAVNHGKPEPPDPDEPAKVAESVKTLGLGYVVITCVTRDDMPDGGAAQMAATVRAIHEQTPATKVEVLCSDYGGDLTCADAVLAAGPAVYGHNVETVERLTPAIRNKADYRRSLAVLEHVASRGALAKSGIMLGLGETSGEIEQTLKDLRAVGVQMLTIGQYLRPTRKHWPVSRLVTPGEFTRWGEYAEHELGFVRAVSGPFVRSSYMAEEAFARSIISKN